MVKLETDSKALNVWVGNTEIIYSEIRRILLVLYNSWKFILITCRGLDHIKITNII